ncbi:hypothetical protein CJJ09_001941 [Candidozyma auris]|nr:hypothetical protein CJJ09_001941 [[Candida] auris]
MLPFLTIFTLAMSLVSGLVLPQDDDASVAKRGAEPLKLDFDIVKDTSKNSTLYHPQRYFENLRAARGANHAKRSTSTTITNDRDISYILDVYLGSQHDKVTVLLDTGSSDLWVYGPGVSSAEGGTFDPSQSSHDQSTGESFPSSSIIFGGIDTDKYEGDLKKYQVSTDQGLGITAQSATVGGKSISLGQSYILDSGTSWNLWPTDLTEAVAQELGLISYQQGLYIVNCDQPSDKSISFDLGENTISIPYSDLIVNVGENGQKVCSLGAQATDYDPYIFGDVFLRSAYVYYDLTDHTISIAQAKYSTSSHIVPA